MHFTVIRRLWITIYIVIRREYRVCDMSNMSFSFSLNVKLYMSKMAKIDQIHLRAVMICMSKMAKEHTHTFLYRVCDMSKVSEMSFSFSLNVILSMLKMLKIDQIHLRAVMQCMSKTSTKSFGKLRLRAFQPYHQILCILKHVEDVKDNLWHLQHASTYIGFDGMAGKP